MGIQFKLLYSFEHNTIGAEIQTHNGPILVLTSYAPPRQHSLPRGNQEFMMRHQTPAIFAGELNCRQGHFGYHNGYKNKRRQLYQHKFNNRVHHFEPIFPTFYTRNTETKPDVVLTNNNF